MQHYAVAALGYVTANAYDDVGRLTDQTRYGTALGLTDSSTISNVASGLSGVTRTTSFFRMCVSSDLLPKNTLVLNWKIPR